MKKLYVIFALIICLSLNLESQTTESRKAKSLLEAITPSDNLPKPFVRVHEFMRQRAYPFEDVPENARIKAIQEAGRMMHTKNATALIQAQQPEWIPIGPFKVGGRIKSVAPHPTKNGWVYVGAAAGGIWRTTDYGANWTPIFDFENGIAFGSIAIDPNHPDTMYAGTGEAVSSAGGGLGGTPIYLGAGLYKSTDAGTTWNLIGLRNVGTFSKVFVHPKNSNFIVAGGCYKGQGFYKSTDAGATWTKTFDQNVTDVTIDPNDENRIFIGVTSEGVYYSSDAGDTWEKRSAGFDAGMGRVSVQLAPSNPEILYALTDISNIGTIYKSTNSGSSWAIVYRGQATFFNGQGWYDNYICVHPTNENIVLAGGIDIFRTSNGGTNWTNVTNGYSGGNVHVDQHHAEFNPLNPNMVYAGNDGGMYKSSNAGQEWVEINNNLQVTQFYSLAVDHSKENRNFGGTQDNGTLGNLTPDNWSWLIGGDGFRVIVDYNNPNIFYGESQYGSLRRINLSNMTSKSIVSGIPTNDIGPWDSPFIMDPNNNVLYHGRHAIYASIDKGDSWVAMTSQKTYTFSSIAASQVNELVIWAGTQVGEVFVCQDGAERGDDSWEEVSENGLANRYLTDIETSYENAGTAYVTFSGYGSGHVFKTTDFGKKWENIGKTLPDAPCNAIAIHPENENILFVGTDVGVFATYDGGNSWLPYGRGLPRSPVIDLSFHLNRLVLPDLMLRAATHGRSMWEVTVPTDIVTDMAITSPAGGEVYVGTSSTVISWYGFTQPVKIEYSINDGSTWNEIANGVVGNYLRWKVPSVDALLCRIRVSSTENSIVSKSFSINKLQKGSVLISGGVKYVPYGITYDGISGLWTTSFYGNKLYKLNGETFAIEKSFQIQGDSLFSDLTLDRENGILYIHKLYSTTASIGGNIYVLDTLGNEIKSYKSPAKGYPIGLEFVDGNLIACDRDGNRTMYKINPEDGTVISQNPNPYNKTYGPRGICYDGSQYLYQVCTYFPSGGSLTEAVAMKIDKSDLRTGIETMNLESNTGGMINARGIDIDPRDNNFWISDFSGNLYKIAGFNTLIADFKASTQSGKVPLDVQFNDNSAGNIISWLWNFGDGGTSTVKNPLHIYETTGKFTVTLTVTDAIKGDTTIKQNYIYVYDDKPIAAFSAVPLSGVAPLEVRFTNNSTGNITSWLWNFGDGGTSTVQNPIHTYDSSGSFTVTLTVSDGSNENTISMTNYIVVYDIKPKAAFTAAPLSGASPLEVQFTDKSEGNIISWLWNFGNGDTSLEQNPIITYQDTGKYSVSLQIKDNADSSEITKTDYINVYPANVLRADFSAEPLKGDIPLTVQFTDLSINNPTSWLWKFGDDSTSFEQNPVHVYYTYKKYTVELTVSNGVEQSTMSKEDYIMAYPPSGVEENGAVEKDILDLRIFPNPMVEFSTISFKSLIDNANVKVQISDMLGRSMGTYFDGTMNKDETHYFQLKAGTLSSGVYYVTVYVNGRQVELKQLVVTQ